MASPAPSRLGPYEILSSLGKGGMGEVWRAQDPRLNREVAIKVSAVQFTDRFEREAHAIASLNHPNICTLFDIGPNYLVMELIEGQTLAERIADGPIPVDEALAIAKQIADALEAAHERNIVHRDLKPANIKIRPDGSVKVLDFGLAKSASEAVASSDSPTMLSVAGMILGTAGYMAPEQARGKTVDKRADIWAFGVVVYEMVTAQRLFEGETVSDTLASVLTREPDWTGVPEKIRRLLKRCLEKDPQKRLRDISGVEFLLEGTAPATAPSRSRPGLGVWIAAVALPTLAAAALAFVHYRESPFQIPLIRFTFGATAKASLNAGAGVAVSPDGRRVVFAARAADGKNQLWVRSFETLAAQPLAGTDNAFAPFWSPDGRSIGFGADGKLRTISADGGPVATLADAPRYSGGTWNRDNVILFSPGVASPILRVAAGGGTPSPVTTVDEAKNEVGHRQPFFLPDGRHFLFTAAGGITPLTGITRGAGTIRLGSIDSRETKVLFEADSGAQYAGGYLLFPRSGTLMAQRFDSGQLTLAGDAVPIAEHIQNVYGTSIGVFSVSDSGMLVYAEGEALYSMLTWLERTGSKISALETGGSVGRLHLSPDRNRAAVAITERGNTDIWIYDFARGIPARFTFDPAVEEEAVWSPDGRVIAFSSTRTGKEDLYRKAADGSGSEELLYADNLNKRPKSWSPDGRYLLYTAISPKTDETLLQNPRQNGAELRVNFMLR